MSNVENESNNKDEKNIKYNNQKYSKKVGNYVLLCEIGTGTFSKVSKAIHIITGQEVAVKILQKDKIKDEIDIERILREIEILKKVIHPNICQLYETYSTIHNYYLMIEHINGGDLFDFITNNNYLSEKKSCQFFRQLISVIEYLNELGISHRDIKPENILLDDSHENIKLIDFGLSNYYTEKKLLKSSCGSPCYASPEMLSGKPYLGITTDLWSAGIVLYSMLVGSLPFDDLELYELYKQIKLGRFYLPSTLSLEAIDLLKNILNVNPKKRIDLEGIKAHKWFQMDGYPLYKGINLNNEKLEVNSEVINYVMKNYFDKDNDLNVISKDEFIDMIRNYYCNKYTATYYLTKKYILKIDDKDLIFKKDKNEKEEIKDDKREKTINLKYDKKICKKSIKDNNTINTEEKSNYESNNKKPNNYLIIKTDINIEIKSEEKKKEDYNFDKNNNNENEIIPNIQNEADKKKLILNAIEEASEKKSDSKKKVYNINSEQIGNKIELTNKQNKNEDNIIKRNFKKNELYLNNIKNTNLKTHYRNSIDIKQKKFTKNLLLKGAGKIKENLISNNNNNTNIKNNSNNSYIKTWGNNSINHNSKNKKLIFNNSGNNNLNNNHLNENNNLNNNNNNNNNNLPKNKYENSTSINSYKTNKNKQQNSKKKNNSNENSYNNKNNNISNNKSPLSSKQKENNFNIYLINNYINQNDSKNVNNNSISNNYNMGKLAKSPKNDNLTESKMNYNQYCMLKAHKYNNILKTIDLPGSYSSRYNNTESNNKKILNSNGNINPYNKIKVNLKTDNNKLSENISPKYGNTKIDKLINLKNSLGKNNVLNNINNYTNKNGNKKINIKGNDKNQVVGDDKALINCLSIKKDNSNSKESKIMNSYSHANINPNYNNNNKVKYQLYYLNEPNSNDKISSNTHGNAMNTNLKNNCLKPKEIYLKNNTNNIIPRRNSTNSNKGKNNNMVKENITHNINNNMIIKNIGNINKNDIYNKKKITNNSTQKSNFKKYIFKELFPIEEDNNILNIKCHINTKSLKNKILFANEGIISNKNNKCNSPKEFYSFNDSGALNSVCHSDLSIINNKKNLKMKQNFSNIYNRKKNLKIKTDQNSSCDQTNSPQSTDKNIKYIYKSKLSLY